MLINGFCDKNIERYNIIDIKNSKYAYGIGFYLREKRNMLNRFRLINDISLTKLYVCIMYEGKSLTKSQKIIK